MHRKMLSEEVLHVLLTNEPVQVWRPVRARRQDDGRYLIVEQQMPQDEIWEFNSGQIVDVEIRLSEDESYLIASSCLRS